MVGRGGWRVPERWTKYAPLGRRVPGTRFVAFKVPLSKGFDHNLLPAERFSPQDLIRKVQERKEELGLIIDLTFTTRYYGREELPPALCHAKVPTMGHQVPGRKSFMRFRSLVGKFLEDNGDNDKLIGVHCTHGLNRTGYLVCRYLIEVEGMEPNTAIELFNKARGHPMERRNYIQDLQRRAQSCELKSLGSDLLRRKGSDPAKPPLAVPRNPGSARQGRLPGPTAQGQPQGLGQRKQKKLEHQEHNHLEMEQQEKRKQNNLEEKEQNHLEQRKKKKQNHLEQNHLQQNHLEQRKQKKQNYLEQNNLEQRQQKKPKLQEMEHQEQRKQKKHDHVKQNKLEHQEQNHLETEQLEHQEQNRVEQKKLKKLKLQEQEHQEQRKQKKLDKRQQKQQNCLEQNHLEVQQQEQRRHKKPDKRWQKLQQPCSVPPRNCSLSPRPKKKKKQQQQDMW
uniref:RNA/RNP complex-1-interacting phosphatase n=1 Tax=Taeniopygia guttata TaxID=59729 RepID=A0A674GC15_TAEGU